ncbi:hypothetical protein PCK1_000680 [Pneumocystis canis]|nr:hypothetical protein PCK1_000680 [Pneumocystis canis]
MTTEELLEIFKMERKDQETSEIGDLNNTIFRPRKKRTKWTIEETNDLLDGCNTYGVGNWKKILHDSRYHFNNRSPIDLKDRFRTIFPQDYRYFYPNAHTHINRQQKMASLSFLPRVNRKERRAFTPDEDARLLEGFMRHGPSWSKIQRDVNFSLSSRRSIDLRDRFRNAFPEKYAAAGFKSRSLENNRKQVTNSASAEPHVVLPISLQTYNNNNSNSSFEVKSCHSHNNHMGDLYNFQSMVLGGTFYSVPNISLEPFQEITSMNTFNVHGSPDKFYMSSSELLNREYKSSVDFVVPQNSNALLLDMGSIIIVTSTIDVSPVFIIHHFISTSIQNGQTVGFDFTSKTCFEKLVYVDGLTKLYGYHLGEGSIKNTFIRTVYIELTGESNIDDIFSELNKFRLQM